MTVSVLFGGRENSWNVSIATARATTRGSSVTKEIQYQQHFDGCPFVQLRLRISPGN